MHNYVLQVSLFYHRGYMLERVGRDCSLSHRAEPARPNQSNTKTKQIDTEILDIP